MASSVNGSPTQRHDFSKIKAAIPIPNLIEVQKDSYERFLQMDNAAMFAAECQQLEEQAQGKVVRAPYQ